MPELDALLQTEPDEWLQALPQYQRRHIDALLASDPDYEAVAEKWLTARPGHTAPFGTTKQQSLFKDKLWEEIENFLCGDDAYEPDRRKLAEQKPVVHSYVVGVISAAIAPILGASGVFLAPAVALLLASIGHVSLNAWCATRKEARSQ